MLLLFKINHISQQCSQTPLTGKSRFFQSTGFCSTTTEELAEHINILQQTKDNLELQRKRLSNHDNPSEANKSTDYEPILKSLKTIRKELRLCNDINKRIFELNENINGYEKNEHKVLLKSTINR